MTPRLDRWGDPIADEPTHQRVCWRCAVPVDTQRPVPVCDGCTAARNHRAESRARRLPRHKATGARPPIEALRRRAHRAAQAEGLIAARHRPWWDEVTA